MVIDMDKDKKENTKKKYINVYYEEKGQSIDEVLESDYEQFLNTFIKEKIL